MIRLIQRRLIIPRGDTGFFTIPIAINMEENDIAVFFIYSPLTHSKIFEKVATIEENVLKINFSHFDTVNLKPGKYVWDIKNYKNPIYIDGTLIGGDEVHSYYAGFKLPVCEIKETADLFLCGNEQNNLLPTEINLIKASIDEMREIAAQAKISSQHYPLINNNYWYVWNEKSEAYINTGVLANGDDIITDVHIISDTELKLTFQSGKILVVPLSGIDNAIPDDEIIYDAGSIDEPDEIIYDGGSIDEIINSSNEVIIDNGSIDN